MLRKGFQPKRKPRFGSWRMYWATSLVLSFLSPLIWMLFEANLLWSSLRLRVVLQDARRSSPSNMDTFAFFIFF